MRRAGRTGRTAVWVVACAATVVACGGRGTTGDAATAVGPGCRTVATATPGAMPAAGPVELAGVSVPAGRVRELAPFDGVPPFDALWVTDAVVDRPAELWLSLVERFPSTGLWPVVLPEGLDTAWLEGGLGDTSANVGAVDVEVALRALWDDLVPATGEDRQFAAEYLRPLSFDFPGLAAPDTRCRATLASLLDRDVAFATDEPARVALVPASRPGDVLARTGWSGPINRTDDMAALAAIVRSWEERFGAVVVAMGFDTLTLLVERPPADGHERTKLAAELFAVDPDLVEQSMLRNVGDLADVLGKGYVWSFWWD